MKTFFKKTFTMFLMVTVVSSFSLGFFAKKVGAEDTDTVTSDRSSVETTGEVIPTPEAIVIPDGTHETQTPASTVSQGGSNGCYVRIVEVSDTTNTVDGGKDFAVPTGVHPGSWVDISGATWIWNTPLPQSGEVPETHTFQKDFIVNGVATSANLAFAADNGYKIWINDILIQEDPSEFNYDSVHTISNGAVLNALQSGPNTIMMEVTNLGVPGTTPESNPAGALYRLDVDSNNCEPQRAYVHVSKFVNGVAATSTLYTGGYAFPMIESFFGGNADGEQGDYTLDPKGNYSHDTVSINIPGFYSTHEVTQDQNETSRVVGIEGTCTNNHCPEDLNYDGTVDKYDLQIVCNKWSGEELPTSCSGGNLPTDYNTAPYSGDTDGNDIVNVDDLLGVINHWGPCAFDYQLEGYTTGDSLIAAQNPENMQSNAPVFEGLSQDKYVVVWNKVCELDTTPPPPPPEEPPVDIPPTGPQGNSGGGGFSSTGGGSGFGGSVLGAAIGPGEVLGESTCAPYLTEYIKPGRKNNPEEVKKLQTFLNRFMKSNLPVTGVYGPQTQAAVAKFQVNHGKFVLNPWAKAGLLPDDKTPTSYVYKTTKWWINMLNCPNLKVSQPAATL